MRISEQREPLFTLGRKAIEKTRYPARSKKDFHSWTLNRSVPFTAVTYFDRPSDMRVFTLDPPPIRYVALGNTTATRGEALFARPEILCDRGKW